MAELLLSLRTLELTEYVGLTISDIYIQLQRSKPHKQSQIIQSSLLLLQDPFLFASVEDVGYNLNLMKSFEGKKFHKYQNQSLMALSSNNAEPTKKTIDTEQFYHFQPSLLSGNRKYAFNLPLSTEISMLLNAFTSKFAQTIIHVESDAKHALVLLQGIKSTGLQRLMGVMLDYLVFCCSRGMRNGRLEQTYSVISITIKREVIQNRCVLVVSNPYREKSLQAIFEALILDPIQDLLRSIRKDIDIGKEEEIRRNESLNQNSPCQLEVHVGRKIYHIFVLNEVKQLSRYKNIFLHSLEKLKEEREKHIQKLSLNNKKSLPNPSAVLQTLIQQTDNLLVCLQNSYKEEQSQQLSFLHSLLTAQSAQQIALYKIEQTLCLYELSFLKQIYLKHTSEQCLAFNSNIAIVNSQFSDLDCFQHLELRGKYRLPREKKPYQSAIMGLRKIQYCLSLRQMLLVIQQCFSQVKSDCLISHEGSEELSSMDDLLPVMIFVTVRAAVHDFPVLVKLIDDYVRLKGVFELEERVMTTLYVAIEDISRSWHKKV